MKKIGIKTALFGLILNFILFLIKLFVGISSASLAIYCDGINNLGDTLSCIIALLGFIMLTKLDERKSNRIQALSSFIIGIILAVTGAYFAYNGIERLMYPVAISYISKYAFLICATVFVKMVMGIVYTLVNRKKPSPVFKALIIDSFLDCAITLTTLLGLTLSVKINFAADSIISMIIGIIVVINALKTVLEQGKYLIND